MRSEWREFLLDEIAELNGGYAFKSEEYTKDGQFVLRTVNISEDGRISRDGATYVSQESAKKYERFLLKNLDTLYVMVGATLGKTGLVKANDLPALLNQNMWVVRARKDRVDPLFLHYAFKILSRPLSSLASGSARGFVKRDDFRKMKICVPEVGTQREISGLLGALDDRINLLRETNKSLEAIAQALFKSWFVDFDPVRAKMQGRQPDGMDEATAALFPDSFQESELGLVPQSWSVDQMDNWLSVLETGRRPKGGVSGIESGVPSIGAESITKIGDFDFSKVKYVPNDFFITMKSGKLISRDVLLYKDGGKPGVFLPRVSMFGDGFPFEICGINEHVFRIRLREPFCQTYLYYWLWSDAVMHELKHRGGKAAIPGINQSDVRELKITVPSGQILERFTTIAEPIVATILNNAKRIQSLSSLRDTLLPRLISGQLRLPEAEAEIEALTA